MAKTKEADNAGDVLEQTKNGKLEDIEFMEQLIAEEDANPLEPPRTDVLYGNAKKWITLSGGAFSGFASMQDIAQRWPKASGTFQRRFHFYKGGVKVHITRVEDLNFNTYSSGVPVSNRKLKEMFPNVPFPWDDQEPPAASVEEPKPNTDPNTAGPSVIYIKGEPNDPEYANDNGGSYFQELGPDKKPTMHFYHLYDTDDGKTEKVYFEHEPFAELTSDEQRLFLQAHASPVVIGQPQQAAPEPVSSKLDLKNSDSVLMFLIEREQNAAREARQDARSDRQALTQMVTELTKTLAEMKGGNGSSGVSSFKEGIELALDLADLRDTNKAPEKHGPLSNVKEIWTMINEGLGTAAKLKANMTPQNMQLLQQIAAEQTAAQNPNNNNGGNK